MSVFCALFERLARHPRAKVATVLSLAVLLGAAENANASERVQDELSRKPVQYQSGGVCAALSGCSWDLLTTPGGKKRIELSGVTCTATSEAGAFLTVYMKRKGVTNDRTLELDVHYNGTWNSKKRYSATSTANFRLPKNTAYEMLAGSSTAVSFFQCTATGDRIAYSK